MKLLTYVTPEGPRCGVLQGDAVLDVTALLDETTPLQGEGSLMHHTWQDFVVRASRDSRIAPGDVFGSGTVTGGTIGEALRNGYPARWLEPSDTVEISVEGIGTLRSTLGPKPPLEAWYGYAAPADIVWG